MVDVVLLEIINNSLGIAAKLLGNKGCTPIVSPTDSQPFRSGDILESFSALLICGHPRPPLWPVELLARFQGAFQLLLFLDQNMAV